MKEAVRDLRVLWATRKSSGFPWPFQSAFAFHSKRHAAHMLVFGHPPWTTIPIWRQALGIPLRPWRYARMVRRIAMVRNHDFAPRHYDDIP